MRRIQKVPPQQKKDLNEAINRSLRPRVDLLFLPTIFLFSLFRDGLSWEKGQKEKLYEPTLRVT